MQPTFSSAGPGLRETDRTQAGQAAGPLGTGLHPTTGLTHGPSATRQGQVPSQALSPLSLWGSTPLCLRPFQTWPRRPEAWPGAVTPAGSPVAQTSVGPGPHLPGLPTSCWEAPYLVQSQGQTHRLGPTRKGEVQGRVGGP